MAICGMLAEDHASDHAASRLHLHCTVPGQEWRGPCPVFGDGSRWFRLSIRDGRDLYRCHCDRHDQAELMTRVAELLPGCVPPPRRRSRRIEPDDLAELMLSGMPPISLKLAGLELAGMTTSDALDKLGIRREHRSRVINGRTKTGASSQVSMRTKTGAGTQSDAAPKRVQTRRSAS